MFATRGFHRDERILSFRGPLLSTESVGDFTHTIQVGVDLFLGASGWIDDYVNHSCEPNCGLRSAPPRLELVSMRAIEPGEEITFDYSTGILDEPALDSCGCGSRLCRGRIGAFWDLDPGTRARYRRLGIVPEFVVQGRPGRSRRQICNTLRPGIGLPPEPTV